MSAIRTRWAAIGAALAVSLGAGGLGVVQAVVDDGPKPVFVPINPCRILDTRDDGGFNVGPRNTPIGADETYEVQAAGGTNGECSDVPASAVGVVMNVTLTDPTLATHVSIWPSDEARPNASNLNTTAGATAVPNLVTTDLSTDGKFSVYNFQGTVNVLADVVGYYEDHNHDDRYYTETESDARFLTGPEALELLSQYLTETEINQLIEDATLGDVDLSDYLTETEIIALLGDFLTETEINALLQNYLTEADGDERYVNEADLAGQTRTGDLPLLTLLTFEALDLDDEIASFGTGITYDAGSDQFTVVDAGVYRVSFTANLTAGLLGTQFQVRVDGAPQGSPASVATLGGSVSDTLLVDVPAGGTVDLAIGGIANLALGGDANFTIERAA